MSGVGTVVDRLLLDRIRACETTETLEMVLEQLRLRIWRYPLLPKAVEMNSNIAIRHRFEAHGDPFRCNQVPGH